MREVASVAWTCARPASCTEYEWFWKAGWQGYCRNAGGMGQLERATANDHCSGGQQVDRKMSIHERGCKGDSTNLWLVILTATRPAWRICKIYFKKKFVINIKALKHFPIVYREKEVIVFIKGRVVLFLQSLNRFLKSYKKGEGGISPKETLIKLCWQSKGSACCRTEGNVLPCIAVHRDLSVTVHRDLTGCETKNRSSWVLLTAQGSPPEDWYHLWELESVLRAHIGPSSYTVDLHFPSPACPHPG